MQKLNKLTFLLKNRIFEPLNQENSKVGLGSTTSWVGSTQPNLSFRELGPTRAHPPLC